MLTALCSLYFLEQLFSLFAKKQALVWASLYLFLWILHPMATESRHLHYGQIRIALCLVSSCHLDFMPKDFKIRNSLSSFSPGSVLFSFNQGSGSNTSYSFPVDGLLLLRCFPAKRKIFPYYFFFGLGIWNSVFYRFQRKPRHFEY